MNMNPKMIQNTTAAFRDGSLALAVTAALAFTPSAQAQLTLVETGGSLMSPNYSTQSGATAFAKDVLDNGGYAIHQTAHIRDGLYGNSFSWIGNSTNSFCGVSFGDTAVSINSVAWGRDNTGGYGDRYSGTYTLEYTTEPSPNASTTSWTLIGTTQGLSPVRHVYAFPAVTATGIRLTCTSAGTCIDELEAGTTSGASMSSFTWDGRTGVINQLASPRTVTLHVPSTTILNPLDPNPVFTLYPGAKCDRNSGGTGEYDFTTPQTYAVTAENGVDTTSYTVTILADLVIPPAPVPPPVAGYSRWFEPSQVLQTNDGDPVDIWLDASGNGANATVPAGNATPTYVADAGTGTGLGAVHFAAGTGGSPALNCGALKFTGDSSIRTVFSVFKGTSFLLTDSGSFHFHRLTNNDPTCPLWSTPNASSYVKGGSTYVNGALVDGETFNMPTNLHNGFNLVEVLTTGNVTASSFNKDRLYNSGDQYHGEVIIYDFLLTEEQRLAVEDYLMAKWFATTPQAKITTFGTNVTGSSAVISAPVANAANIAWTVPFGTNVTTLAPEFTLSIGATCDLASGATQNFSSPVVYTVTSSDDAIINVYTVSVTVDGPPLPFMALTGDSTTGTLMENNEADGYRFQTGGSTLTVNWLGLYDAKNNNVTGAVGDGLLTSHRVSIWRESDGVLVAQTTVLTTDALEGNFRSHNITPVTLAANTGYVIAADYGGTGDRQWEGADTAEWGVYSGISNLEGRYGGPGGGMPTGGWGVMVGPNFGNTVVGGYGTWATANAPGQTPGEDYDNDGVKNGLEYFMGQTGSSFTAMPGLDATNTVTWTKDPTYNGAWQVQTSPNLSTWNDVAGTDNGTSVSYTLPPGLGKQFVRLLVTPTPSAGSSLNNQHLRANRVYPNPKNNYLAIALLAGTLGLPGAAMAGPREPVAEAVRAALAVPDLAGSAIDPGASAGGALRAARHPQRRRCRRARRVGNLRPRGR